MLDAETMGFDRFYFLLAGSDALCPNTPAPHRAVAPDVRRPS